MTVSVQIEAKALIDDLKDAYRSFAGRPQELKLPTAPIPAILLREEPIVRSRGSIPILAEA